jgi:hypothetical protein
MVRIVAAVTLMAVASSSVWADVVPSRYADPDAQRSRDAVQGRLERMGVADAAGQAGSLSDGEALYLAQAPERIQRAGQAEYAADATIDPAEKWVYGIVFLVGTIAGGTAWYLHND